MRVQNFRRRYFDRPSVEAGIEGLVPDELRHTGSLARRERWSEREGGSADAGARQRGDDS